MTRTYTNLLIEALDNGTISYESVAKSFLSFLSEDQVQEFVESDFSDLIEEEEKEWFMHNCQSNNQYDEMHGCPSCDDQCIFCS